MTTPTCSIPNNALTPCQAPPRSWTTLLGAVAAVSLLVGGIGIMNIMLAGVMGIPYLFNRTINLLSFQFSASIDVLFDVRRRWTRVRR